MNCTVDFFLGVVAGTIAGFLLFSVAPFVVVCVYLVRTRQDRRWYDKIEDGHNDSRGTENDRPSLG